MIKIKEIFFAIVLVIFLNENANSAIKDSIFATVGNKAITKSDIIKEIKVILILNGKNFSDEDKERIESSAISSIIKRTIKQIEIEKYTLTFKKSDIEAEIKVLADSLNMDTDTLNNIFLANGIDFKTVRDQIETELLWNSLIFQLYKDRLTVNIEEIEEQLKFYQEKKEIQEFLISELIIKPVPKEQAESKIKEIKERIKTEGFKKVATDISISETALKGGSLGWINENEISEEFRSKIKETNVGDISSPIFLPEGILFFELKDVRKTKIFDDLEEAKKRLINSEKTKILNMHSLSHYDNLRRSVTINYY